MASFLYSHRSVAVVLPSSHCMLSRILLFPLLPASILPVHPRHMNLPHLLQADFPDRIQKHPTRCPFYPFSFPYNITLSLHRIGGWSSLLRIHNHLDQ